MIILHEFKEMAKIAIKHQNDLNFDRRKTLRKSTNTFNYRIFTDTFPYCMLFLDKYNTRDRNQVTKI